MGRREAGREHQLVPLTQRHVQMVARRSIMPGVGFDLPVSSGTWRSGVSVIVGRSISNFETDSGFS
mgnify:CR=1 FL=1